MSNASSPIVLPRTPTSNHDRSKNMHPRLCILHKWSHYDGYGIHLTWNEEWRGLHIDHIEANSPAESAGLLREDIVLAINGRSIEKEDFFLILSFIQHELTQDPIRFLVLDPQSAAIAKRYQITIDENNENCIRKETAKFIEGSNKPIKPLVQNPPDTTANDASEISDSSKIFQSEPRLCSITTRSGAEPIGISLQSDTNFSHVITRVRPNSHAARAGIEQDDCILFLNDMPLLHIPFEDVLYHLAKSHNASKLNFLVAKRSYLLQTPEYHSNSSAHHQLLLAVPVIERNRSSTLPILEPSERLSYKSADQLMEENRRQRMKLNEQYDRLSLQIHGDSSVTKYKKKLGKILHGIGPVANIRLPWSPKSDKEMNFSSTQSDLHDQEIDVDDKKDHLDVPKDNFSPLQVGMTNQSPVSAKRLHYSPKLASNSDSIMKTNHHLNTPSPLLKHPPTGQNALDTPRIGKQDNQKTSSTNLQLAAIPISELSNHGYDLFRIQLMKPTETIPVGFKLSKKTNPLRYVMTLIVEGSKADMAGLHVDDWLIQIEEKDIRLIALHDVLQDIYRLFNTVGFLNMLIARKKSPSTEDQPNSNEEKMLETANPMNNASSSISTPEQSSNGANLNQIRRVNLKDASRLYFNSFKAPHNDQIYVHLINNVPPISIAHHAGLRNGDRILTVNSTDVTTILPEDLRIMLSKTKSVELTVIKYSKSSKSLEIAQPNENQTQSHDTPTQSQSRTVLFTDDQGPVYVKYCVIQRHVPYSTLGLSLCYENGVHTVTNIDTNYPGYHSGLRDHDIILFVNKKNVQHVTHDHLTSLLRSLVLSNQMVDLITIHQIDLERYQSYRRKRFIDWHSILSKIDDPSAKKIQPNGNLLPEKQRSNTASSMGERVCVLEPKSNRPIGFRINQFHSPPFTICQIEKDSSAEKAGLRVNDTLVSINGKSVLQSNYEEIMQIINEAHHEQFIQIVVNQPTTRQKSLTNKAQSSSLFNSDSDDIDSMDENVMINASSNHRRNVVQQYQSNYLQRENKISKHYRGQRMKELSHAARLCHLNPINLDGTSASSLGFEMTGNSEYGYPMITRVEPKSPGERGGLQADDILLKVNNRKTKGVDFEKIQKTIEKAKRNKRLEMLVVDKETFYYCLKAKKKIQEPYIRVKHVFPPMTSSNNHSTVPLVAVRTIDSSVRSINQIDQESDSPSSMTMSDTFPVDISAKFTDPARRLSQGMKQQPSSTGNSDQNTSSATRDTSTDESIMNFVMDTVNTFFHNIGTDKSINLDYDVPPDRVNGSKTHTPLLSTFRPEQNFPKEKSMQGTAQVDPSTPSYDYIRDLRRCVLEIDREKGLGFILSATGDYDHTITSVDKHSTADAAGLQIYDEIIEINGTDVRSIKYEQVVEMLISAMRMNDSIELSVVNNHLYSSAAGSIKDKTTPNLSNLNNNNNNNFITSKRMAALFENTFLGENNTPNPSDIPKQHTVETVDPQLRHPLKQLNHISDRNFSRSVPALSTGITASPKDIRSMKTMSSQNDSPTKVLSIFKNDVPVARLCRIRKFPSSPFYGFFLCGNPKKLGRVFVSNIAKNSSAAICGLRDGDHIIEVNGTNIRTLTYETILNIIKLHMEHENLELLVLDKKSARWFHRRKYPITSQTLPTIVHIEPIINQVNSDVQFL